MAVDTFYSSQLDARVTRNEQDVAWAAIHDAADGLYKDNGGTDYILAQISASTTSNQWASIWRSFFLFDISAIAGATINSVDFYIYIGTDITDALGGGHSLSLIDTNPASTSALALTDYTDGVECGTTLQATAKTLASLSTSTYAVFTLNATGIASVQAAADGDGIAKFGFRIEKDRTNTAPTWASTQSARILCNYYNAGDLATSPKLVIDYTLPILPNLKSVNSVVTASIKSINGVAIASVKSVNGIT